MGQDTADTTRHTERPHRSTRAKWPRTPHTKHNSASEHTGQQDSSGPRHDTRNTTHRADPAVNRSKVALNTTHTTQRIK